LKRINDTFNLIAPDLLSEKDIAAQEAALNNISSKLDDIAGTGQGSYLNECIRQVNEIAATDPSLSNADGAPLGPVGRIPFPPELINYLSPDVLTKIKYSVSFLPDYYYGNSTGGSASLEANPGSKIQPGNWVADAKKTIRNDDALQINTEQYPYSLAGLEYVLGIY
jgi:hypothetical protein